MKVFEWVKWGVAIVGIPLRLLGILILLFMALAFFIAMPFEPQEFIIEWRSIPRFILGGKWGG